MPVEPPLLYCNTILEKNTFQWGERIWKRSSFVPTENHHLNTSYYSDYKWYIESLCTILGSLEQTSFSLKIQVGEKQYSVPEQLKSIDWNPKHPDGVHYVQEDSKSKPFITAQTFFALTGIDIVELLGIVDDLHRPVNQLPSGQRVTLDLTGKENILLNMLSAQDGNALKIKKWPADNKDVFRADYMANLVSYFDDNPNRLTFKVQNNGQPLKLVSPKVQPTIKKPVRCCEDEAK